MDGVNSKEILVKVKLKTHRSKKKFLKIKIRLKVRLTRKLNQNQYRIILNRVLKTGRNRAVLHGV